jgi:hypothetical protein
VSGSEYARATSRVDTANAASEDVDEILVAFVIDALGCSGEPLHRTVKPPGLDPSDKVPHAAASFERVATSTWRVEATTCTLRIERIERYFPGDVNEPPSGSTDVVVEGMRRDRPTTVRIDASVGELTMQIVIDGTAAERDAILDKFWRAFGQPK